MTQNKPIGTPPHLEWTDKGHPVAADFDDGYFSDDAEGEVQHVFIRGTGLDELWQAPNGPRSIGETGFGTGLNFLMVWDLWRRSPHSPDRLDFLSAEAWPMSRAQLAQAHAAFPSLSPLGQMLQQQWPAAGIGPGRRTFAFEGGRVRLHLFVDEALQAVQSFNAPGGIDVWFLDGFAPAQNPAMWTPALFTALAKQSAAGAPLASFTAVGEVRRQLSYAGFDVTRAKGFGRKRHMTTARYAAASWHHWALPPKSSADGPIAVVGGGVAGLTIANALLDLGCEVTLFEQAASVGNGASGLPAALLMPRPDMGTTMRAQLTDRGFAAARSYWDDLGVFCQTGVDHYAQSASQASGFAAYAQKNNLEWNAASGMVRYDEAGYVDAPAALSALVVRFVGRGGKLCLSSRFDVQMAGDYAATIWATGAFGAHAAQQNLPYRMMAGELAYAECNLSAAQVRHHHAVPLKSDLALVGASFIECGGADLIPPIDQLRIDAMLSEWGPAAPDHDVWQGVRATLPDQLPICGPLVDQPQFQTHFAALAHGPFASPKGQVPYLSNQWMVNGLGARGFLLAPLLAQTIADMVVGRAARWGLPELAALHPARFVVRDMVKGRKTA